MKIKLTKAIGSLGDGNSVGKVHLLGPIDTTACGLALEEYDFKKVSSPLTCSTCQTFHEWAKKVAKIKD